MAKTGLTPLMISAFVGVPACGSAGPSGSSGTLASERQKVAAEFDLIVANDTNAERYVTIYQDHIAAGSYDVQSLAWKTVALQPHEEFQFEWSENYSFNWSNAALPEGGSYSPTGTSEAGTATRNEVVLTDAATGTVFDEPSDGPEANELIIDVDTPNARLVGIGLAGAPLYVAVAAENAEYTFDVSDPEYFLSVGTQKNSGQVFDADTFDARISFTQDIGTVLKATISESGSQVTLTID